VVKGGRRFSFTALVVIGDEVAATRGLTISQVLPVSAKPDEEEESQPEPPAEPVAVAEESDGEAEDHADA